MKFKHGVSVLLASTILMAGCTTDRGEIKSYNKQVDKANDEEKIVNSVGEKINTLEQEKQKLVKSVSGKNQEKVQKTSEKIVDNVKERKDEFEKEEKAFDKSEAQYKKGQKHIDNIENKQKQKMVKKLDKAQLDKYKAHKKYADAYDDVLKKEKAMFKYTSGDNVEQSQIDKKSKEVSESYKKMNEAFKKYSDTVKKVKDEKQQVDTIS